MLVGTLRTNLIDKYKRACMDWFEEKTWSLVEILILVDRNNVLQIKYVVELARALAKMPGVYTVDLFTRQISSPEIDWSYGEPTEMLTVGGDDDENIGESSGAYIIRIHFGPRDKYLRKELLWPYIQEFVDGALAHILNMSKVLGEQVGGDNLSDHITKQEIDEQWRLYDGFDVKLEKVLRARARRGVNCHGRYMPRMAVIPPGMDFSYVMSQEDGPEADGEIFQLTASVEGSSPKAVPSIWAETMRFFMKPHKPVILALSRPDPKNLTTLLKVFGESRPLRELANLILIMGNRDDIDEMSSGNASVLTTVLKMIDKYDLYGRVAYPKHHKQSDGVFINPALVEPFGLTLIEDPDQTWKTKSLLSKMKKPYSAGGLNDINKLPDNVNGKYPLLWRRRRLIVIALDIYDDKGAPDKTMIQIVQTIIKAAQLDPQNARVSGFALSTAMPMLETVEFLKSGNIQANDFDVLICSSGSEVYDPGTYSEDGKLLPDPDYETHIDYRWGCEGLKKTIWNLMNIAEGEEKLSSPIEEDLKSSNAHCISYKIKDLTKAKRVDDLRQKLRMRGLRCHPMYCRGSSSVQVIPLPALRAQALRYLFVRWGLNVANMFVFLGETGDTDYEELISGTHKTLIMKGVVSNGSEAILRGPGSYLREDVVPNESPLVACISETTEDNIANTLNELSKSGMM
ncbi:hypothetical protein VNO80_30410 [Phaseolus coccineus]|uniref:Sucrose phosphatase-like domain-containing protein n=1 Tax=Phaseolus coccineus TaxID=3886 RepID=A0AAN9QFT3_PHACN